MDEKKYKERISEYHNIGNKEAFVEYPLKGLHIELSNVCNHRCLFCANRKMTRPKTFIDEKFLLRILKEAYGEGFREVGFYANGEPFMSKNLSEYIKWAKEIGYSYVYIDTNGGVSSFDRIQSAIDAGLDSIKFSINGTSENNYEFIHGVNDFDRVIGNLKKTYGYREDKKIKLKIFVSIAVTNVIENSLNEFRDCIKPYCDEIVANNIIEMGGYISEELNELRTNTKLDFYEGMRIPCYMLWNGLFVTCEGYLTACCADFQNYFVYADLNKTSIREAWNNDIISKLRNRHLMGNVEGLPCVSCVYGRKEDWVPLSEEFATIIENRVIDGFDIYERKKLFESRVNSSEGWK